jgi:mRNA-degrading endonuclease RelE of RelBE toxin-antitoxin system
MFGVRYRIEISEKARDQLRAFPKDVRRSIGHRIEAMRDDLRGDVVKLRTKATAIGFVSARFVFSSFSPET